MSLTGRNVLAFHWLALAATGAVAGLALGSLAVGGDVGRTTLLTSSYSELSGNPASLSVDSHPVLACEYCADSYGVAARLAARDDGDLNDDSFYERGAVAFDDTPIQEPSDDDRYGGRFPDAVPEYPAVQVAADSLAGPASTVYPGARLAGDTTAIAPLPTEIVSQPISGAVPIL